MACGDRIISRVILDEMECCGGYASWGIKGASGGKGSGGKKSVYMIK